MSPASVVAVANAELALDFTTGEAHFVVLGQLVEGDRPERLWLGAYFVHPRVTAELGGADGSWSFPPFEVEVPAGHGDHFAITGSTHFHWWDNLDLPDAGYFGDLVLGHSSEDAEIRIRDRSYLLSEMRPVHTKPRAE